MTRARAPKIVGGSENKGGRQKKKGQKKCVRGWGRKERQLHANLEKGGATKRPFGLAAKAIYAMPRYNAHIATGCENQSR